jgi:hypothetical protein
MNERVRLAGIGAIAGGLLWSVAIVVQQTFSYDKPSSGTGYYVVQVLAMLAFAGFLVGVQGLDWSRAVSIGRFGRWSLRAFEVGLVVLILASISILVTRSEESPLFPLGGLMIAIAGVLTGIDVARTAALTGWRRFAPLLVILFYVFGMVIPIILSTDNGDVAPEIIWGATWVILGLAYLLPSTGRAMAPSSPPELTKSPS